MLGTFTNAVTSRVAGPVASVVAVMLAIALATSWSGWEARRLALERRIAELTVQSERSRALMKAELAECRAEPGAQRVTRTAYGPAGAGSPDARRLLEREPEGIDACARMESADQAVLSNLK